MILTCQVAAGSAGSKELNTMIGKGGAATVTIPDSNQSNSVTHVIDAVLLPN